MMVGPSPKLYDLIIVGGGVVGLSILRAATLEGWNCALVEAESDLVSHASGSNSGIACTGVDASPGTLERALIRDSISQLRIFCRKTGVPMRPCGSLVCSWPWDEEGNGNLDHVLEESHSAGDTHASKLSSSEVRILEPNLSPGCTSAIHIPGEIVLDPWLYTIALAAHARENGAHVYTNFEFDPESSFFEDGVWTVAQKLSSTDDASPIGTLRAKAVVNAAGVNADDVQAKVLGDSSWKTRPRRGQYRLYKPNKNTKLLHPIQPIPTQRTKGIFIFSTLYGTIVVGPTALDQDSKTDRNIDSLVARELDHHVKRVLPGIDVESDFIGEYVGIRPGTDKRDYQIEIFPNRNWITVGGIRSTGLTGT